MASRVVRARLDDASERGLSALMREGRNESEAVRAALVEAGARRRRHAALAEEGRRLADDPAGTAERQAVLAVMGGGGPPWGHGWGGRPWARRPPRRRQPGPPAGPPWPRATGTALRRHRAGR